MTKLLMTITIFLCLAGVVEAQQSSNGGTKPKSIYEVVVHPEEIYFGDPVYIGIYIRNISDTMATYDTCWPRYAFWLSLFSEDIPVPYHLLHEDMTGSRGRIPYAFHDFQPRESVLVLVACQELPALEDMNFPFWEEAKKKLKSGGNIVAQVGMECRSIDGKQPPEPNYEYVSKPLLIKPRPGSEMELLQNWLEGTPERLRPVPFDQVIKEGRYYYDAVSELKDEFDAITLTPKPGFVSKERYLKINRNDRLRMASNEHFIHVQGKDYFPYYFVRRGNRKPGDPVCPKTWQGWKGLEESLSPSTMRDEIRLTRIIIQYCDTQDEKVLTELKEWFADMNELQRWSMIYSILELAKLSAPRNDALNPSFSDLYDAIREYDHLTQTANTDYFLPQKTRTFTEKSRMEITKKDQNEFFFVFWILPWFSVYSVAKKHFL